ncbi:stabilizer of axonemal microtubules 2 [Silurus meridionalis]|nr:stabilizer of axonemal microtubules 2 [Silurus meridionalis]
MKRLCLCEICECGRHRCKHLPTALFTKGNQGWAVSEYNEKYPTYKNCHPPKILKPKPEIKCNYGPMEGTTTFRSHFIPYEVSPRPEIKRPKYQPSPGVIDFGSTYKQEFGPYQLQPVLPFRPKERKRGTDVKADTLPTYKDHFRQWAITRQEPHTPKMSFPIPTAKYQNTTTYHDEFIPLGLVPCESFKPSNIPKLSDVPFEGVTSNQLHYIPHPLNVHFVKAPHEFKPSDQPFQNFTSHRHDYQGLPGQMPKSCKPEHVAISQDTPFQSSTEFRDRFLPWPVTPIQVHKTPEYKSPTERMDLRTTTGTNFLKHQIQPFIPARPPYRPVCSSHPFEGTTTTKEDFKAWKGERQETIRQPSAIQLPSGKMEDVSTFKSHYIQHQLQPTVSCKPLPAPQCSKVPMDEETTYRTQFTPKKISMCPASMDPMPGLFRELSSQEQKSTSARNAGF